jgi:glycosyltransferase involved in cell wall biosynthesis
MNVLLITYSFPPAGGVGVLRALSLAKYLPEAGIRLDVLTARNAAAVGVDSALVAQVPPEVSVHRTWTLDLPFALRKAIKRAVSGRHAAQPSIPASRQPRPALLRRVLGNLLLPDPQIGWLPFALRKATRVIRKRRIDLVLITVPPFSTVCLVPKLRRRFPTLPIVLDFRDEWLATTIHLVSFNSNGRARRMAARIEAQAVHDATSVVAVSEAARAEIRNRYPSEPDAKFRCVPNGFDIDPEVRPTALGQNHAASKVVLTYAGSVYGSTDPSSLIQAVLGLPAHIRTRLHIRFLGRIELDRYARALRSLGDTVEIRGFVPHAEALRVMEASTYLLLISHDRLNISGKLYDYLGSGKPILGVVHPQGDVRRVLDETGAGWWADAGDISAIGRLLTDAVERAPSLAQCFHPDARRIAGYHRRALAHRYAGLLAHAAGASRSC